MNVPTIHFHNDLSSQVHVSSIAGGATDPSVGKTAFQGVELIRRRDFAPLIAISQDVYL